MKKKKGYPRYKPIRVHCDICGQTWTGNQNGLIRHQETCRNTYGKG